MPKRERQHCGTCNGSGQMDCIQCWGTGTEKRRGHPEEQPCGGCGGAGKKTCTACGGKGWYWD